MMNNNNIMWTRLDSGITKLLIFGDAYIEYKPYLCEEIVTIIKWPFLSILKMLYFLFVILAH